MFRKEALKSREMRWRGSAILLPGIPLWVIALFCSLFVMSFITFISLGTYTRRINVSGEITTLPRPINIYSNTQGFIIRRYVNEGELIKKDDPIYQIDVSKSTTSGVVSVNKNNDIRHQLERVKDIITRLEDSKKITLNSLNKQLKQYDNAYKISSDIITRAEEGIRTMKENMDNYKNFHSRGLITKDQLTYQESLYYQQQNNLLNLSSQKDQNILQVTNLTSQIQTQAADFDNRIYQMELQRYDLQKELVENDQGSSIIVRALSDGKVDSMSVTVGQMVNAGDSLLQLLPNYIKNYYLVLWVPNDAVAYISEGDKVNIRYDAFPSEKFGQFSGIVKTISRTPASRQEMMTYQGAPADTADASGPWYKVIVLPNKQAIAYDDKSLSLENGMKAESTLFLEKRKIYQWMLSPFYDMKHSATGQIDE